MVLLSAYALQSEDGRLFSRVYRRLSAFALFSLLLLASAHALAWNAAGHRLVATIAWQALTQAKRADISALLQHHPEYQRWQSRVASDADPDLGVFMNVANWADSLRHDRRFYAPGEHPTPKLPGYPDMLRHSDWHYQDAPYRAGDGHLYAALRKLSRQLSTQRPSAQRAYALAWLLHLVADAHQPLHNGFRPDRGGNSVPLNSGPLLGHPDNLHAFWDTLPGSNRLRDDEITALAITLRTENPIPSTLIHARFALWQKENLALAQHVAYPPPALAADPKFPKMPLTLDDAFIASAKAAAQHQLVLAGYRLAFLLEQATNPEK